MQVWHGRKRRWTSWPPDGFRFPVSGVVGKTDIGFPRKPVNTNDRGRPVFQRIPAFRNRQLPGLRLSQPFLMTRVSIRRCNRLIFQPDLHFQIAEPHAKALWHAVRIADQLSPLFAIAILSTRPE